jgi:hypothetical protein
MRALKPLAAQPRVKVREKCAREIAWSTPERTFLDHCFGRGILGHERLPSIGASEQESAIDPSEATIKR